MATSRPIREGDRLTRINDEGPTGYGAGRSSVGGESTQEFVLQDDFGLTGMTNDQYRITVCDRVFGVRYCADFRDPRLAAAVANGTAPGLYVREGDDTSNWEVYREVLARRVEEAMAVRRVGEAMDSPRREAAATIGVLSDGREVTVNAVTGHVAPTAAARQDDEIRVGDVVEVVSCMGFATMPGDIGCRGTVSKIEIRASGTRCVCLEYITNYRLPIDGVVSLRDVRKVTSPSPPTIVAATVSPMPNAEAARIEAAVSDGVRRQMSSPLASGGDEVTIRHVVNPAPPAGSVWLQSRDFTTASVTEHLQSLGATHIHISRTLEGVPVIEVTGLSQQAFDTARQNLPVGVQLRAAVTIPAAEAPRRITAYDRWSSNGPQSSPQPPSRSPTPPQPSRFSLLEVDVDAGAEAASPPQAPKASVDLTALQAELRAEREAKRALAAAQTPQGRFDLLECDLPAVPAVAVKPIKTPRRPVVSSPSPKPLNPVETITDLTAARSPLELARMLAGLDEELSTMMRQREAN